MGQREVRMVPLGWEHPRDERGHHVPLFSQEDLYRRLRSAEDDPDEYPEPPDLADYMPKWPEDSVIGYCLYETTSEGTPVSPVFATHKELADWCEDGATVFADIRQSRNEWLRSFQNGTTDSDTTMVFWNSP